MPSSSGSLSQKTSCFLLWLHCSKNSLCSSSDESLDGWSSHSSSLESPILTEKMLPPLPLLFSPCSLPIDQYYHDSNFSPVCELPPPMPSQSRFRTWWKPAPEYIPSNVLPTPDSLLSYKSALDSESSDPENSELYTLQNVRPNVSIVYEHNSLFMLATTFMLRCKNNPLIPPTHHLCHASDVRMIELGRGKKKMKKTHRKPTAQIERASLGLCNISAGRHTPYATQAMRSLRGQK
ncbi:hypothetical protein B0H17DRAFT_1130035 [Mycena rosella]|uniref:Uncharacterized protein n=1 Tax=Mycena rosella TaxID=1033263 RepID=A0AAD7DS60_MYCRO|nr:hypothetical protein B0H17DRAFT_1130035 [Mycena rosella]